MSDYINFDDLFEEVDLPVPLSPLPPTPVSSPRPMSTAEIPELYFGKSVEESPERSLAETVAQSLEPCSTDPRAASPRPGPSMTKPTFVQRKTDPPHRKRSRSKEEKKSSKRRRTDERKSSDRPTSPEARPQDPRSPEARQHDPRSQEVRPHDPRSPEARQHDPRSPEARQHDPRSQEARPHEPKSPEARPRDFKTPTRHIPAFGRRFLPSSWEEARPQIFFHHHGMAVFSCRDDGFTLTNLCRVLRFEPVVRQDLDEMSHLHRHWYGLCHRCPIQVAISGLSK
ncbi:hypothetical protein NPIL_478441 [Nephila pilipes]|uniref:Uncharacterized protein n=1 Tax=Nephila pilipes TaxID=299642 RepID=A0A8X6MF15_NEPPI|nr:hypothetical protein NPIL_478441 [Nephila pilipes]